MIIKTRNLTKKVPSEEGELIILNDINLELEKEKSLAVVGPSGSGKSTLLGLLAGLDSPSSGEIFLNDQPLHELSEDQRAKVRKENVAFVFQSFELLPGLTAIENVMLPSELNLDKDGFLKITTKSKLAISKQRFDFILNKNEISFYSNKYQKKFILSQDNLNSILKLIFDRDFCNFLTSQTGFKYSVDFFGAYQNFPIPKENIDKPWYANHYHFDKPNSKNMLKVFIPMTKIGINDGPLELIDINKKKQYLVGGFGDIFLCKLNVCLHKAGVPKEDNRKFYRTPSNRDKYIIKILDENNRELSVIGLQNPFYLHLQHRGYEDSDVFGGYIEREFNIPIPLEMDARYMSLYSQNEFGFKEIKRIKLK